MSGDHPHDEVRSASADVWDPFPPTVYNSRGSRPFDAQISGSFRRWRFTRYLSCRGSSTLPSDNLAGMQVKWAARSGEEGGGVTHLEHSRVKLELRIFQSFDAEYCTHDVFPFQAHSVLRGYQ